jgi:ubiquinone/menaquinone biosynthesis C-methylase UbiE
MKKRSIQELERDLKMIRTENILDVATGRGEFLNTIIHALGSYKSVTGIDSNESALNMARESFRKTNSKFLKMDAYNLTFKPESFDMVCLSNSLHHFSDIEQILANMKKVLKTGGYFIINEMHKDNQQTEEQKTHILMHHWWSDIDTRSGIVHNKTFNSSRIVNLVSALQLQELKIYEYAYQINDPKDEKMIASYMNYIDSYSNKIKDHDDFEMLREQGRNLKMRLRDIGFAPASNLFVMGKK